MDEHEDNGVIHPEVMRAFEAGKMKITRRGVLKAGTGGLVAGGLLTGLSTTAFAREAQHEQPASSLLTASDYETEFQQRAGILIDQVADTFVPPCANVPPEDLIAYIALGKCPADVEKYYWPKVLARFHKYGVNDSYSSTYIQALAENNAYFFAIIGMARIMSQFPTAPAVVAYKERYLMHVFERNDSYNAWNGEGTENQIVLDRTSAYIHALQALNDPAFPDAATRLANMQQWIYDWSRLLYRGGNGEWDSSIYIVYAVESWLNIYDFAADQDLKNVARAVLDYYATALALKYTQGVLGGSEMRGANEVASTNGSGADYLAWLWYDDTPKPMNSAFFKPYEYIQSMYAALSTYRPPLIAVDLARKKLPAPANYWNSKASYLMNVPSLVKEQFYIGPSSSYTVGTSFSPYGGWAGGEFQTVSWKLVARTASGTSAYVVTGDGNSRALYGHNGYPLNPWDQYVQYKNVVIQMTRVPTNASAIEATVNAIFTTWQQNWLTDFTQRFPNDTYKQTHNPVGSVIPNDNTNPGSYVSYPATATVVTNGNVVFLQMEDTYIALHSLYNDAPAAPVAAGARSYVQDLGVVDVVCGFVVEVGTATEHSSFDNFQSLILSKNGLDKSLLASQQTVRYTSLENDCIQAQYQTAGSFTEPDYDWDYGVQTPQLEITSPPFVEPSWPSGEGYGRRAKWTVNGVPIDLDLPWPVYGGPNVIMVDRVLTLREGDHGYIVEYLGHVPKFYSW